MLTRWRTQMRLRAVARAARLCTVANQVLAARLRQWQSEVAVIPMALNEQEWHPRPEGEKADRICLGWSGAPGNLRYLEALAALLR